MCYVTVKGEIETKNTESNSKKEMKRVVVDFSVILKNKNKK